MKKAAFLAGLALALAAPLAAAPQVPAQTAAPSAQEVEASRAAVAGAGAATLRPTRSK